MLRDELPACVRVGRVAAHTRSQRYVDYYKFAEIGTDFVKR